MEEQNVMGTETAVEPAAVQEPDFVGFVQQYPGLDAKTIPQSVWGAVKKGDSLLDAYRKHEVQQLRADNQRMQMEMETLRRNADNRSMTLGSMRSAGKAPAADRFLMGFEQA